MSSAPNQIPQISVTQLKERLDNGEDIYLLDVRNPNEWEVAVLDGSVKLSLPDIQFAAQEIMYSSKPREETDLAQVPQDREVVVYCHSGNRSAYTIMMLRELGYDPSKLVNLAGGIDAWALEVDPSMRRY